ncbi:Hypothetical predicted protein [Mytilus galloprovincialis]|uniref:Uncharacterized protein n=1 Tax=Mytilus galloprovincialis TaxID=29158 RepID=A0A8B6BNY7_MYTGA|nr:Hypothetical predicted protein [Mytilus galloprovincialis]
MVMLKQLFMKNEIDAQSTEIFRRTERMMAEARAEKLGFGWTDVFPIFQSDMNLVTTLKNRFGSVNRAEVFRAELQTRVRFKNESLPELAQSIKKLTRRAYPGTSPLVRDTLALDSFIDAIPETEVRLRLREVGPKSINEAENIAVRLEALRVADIRKGRNVRIVDIETVQEPDLKREINEIKQSIESLTSEVLIIKNQNDQQFRGDNNYRGNKNNFNRNFNNRGAFRR